MVPVHSLTHSLTHSRTYLPRAGGAHLHVELQARGGQDAAAGNPNTLTLTLTLPLTLPLTLTLTLTLTPTQEALPSVFVLLLCMAGTTLLLLCGGAMLALARTVNPKP